MNLPPTLTKDRIRRSFDRARDTYAKAAKVQTDVAETCASNVPCGHYPAILEIGAGGGILTHHIAKRCSHDRYVGVDISSGMLAQVDKSALTNPQFITADGELLGFEADTFDLLVSSSTMQWYRTPKMSMLNNFRTLKPGGRFSITIFVEGTFPELAKASTKTGFGSLLVMRPADFYTNVMKDIAPAHFAYKVSTHTTHHASVSNLLQAHRATGATATSGDKRPSKTAYQRFLEYYESNFRDVEGVRSTASILHIWGQR